MDFVKLGVGDFGDEVASLHESLKNQGFAVSADETRRKFFGPATREAVWEFQKRQRLEVNGIVDQKTALALSLAGAPTPELPQAARGVAAAQPPLRRAPGRAVTEALPSISPAAKTESASAPGAIGSSGAAAVGGLHGQFTGQLGGLNLSLGETFAPRFGPGGETTSEFAPEEEKLLPLDIAANASTEVLFGPPTAGYTYVTVEMFTASTPQGSMARRVGDVIVIGGGTGTGSVATALNDQTGGGGGGGGGGRGSLLPNAFRIEVIPPSVGATPVAQGFAPFAFTIPPLERPRMETTAFSLGSVEPKWKLRVTNTTTFDATGSLYVSYYGTRPVLHTDLDLDALNHLLSRIIAGSRPVTVALENRTLTFSVASRTIKKTNTWLIAPADQDMQRQFGVHEFDLGAKLIDKPDGQREESEPLEISLVVNDGRLALKIVIDFPYDMTLLLGEFVLNLLDSLIPDVPSAGHLNFLFAPIRALASELRSQLIEALKNGIVNDSARVITLGADITFTMRDLSLGTKDAQTNTCDVLLRPRIDLAGVSGTVTTLVTGAIEAICSHPYDVFNPGYKSLKRLRHIAELIWSNLGHYLLKLDAPELVRQATPGGIRLLYAGDKPQEPTRTLGDVGAGASPLPDPGLLANIDHIVVLMMENRSFDQMLGHLSLPTALGGLGRRNVDGLRGTEFNLKRDGSRAYVFPFTHAPATLFGYDPGHSFPYQKIQRGGQKLTLPTTTTQGNPNKPPIDDGDIDDDLPNEVTVPPMGGFVLAHGRRLASKYTSGELADTSRNYGSVATDIMGYHLPASVPIYSFLAANALICDRWYAAHPGDTWPNRFITLTGNLAPKPPHDRHAGFAEIGTPDPEVFTPVHVKNIFDHLTAANVTWRYYEHDMCMLRLFADYTLGHPNIVHIDDPVRGLEAAARDGTLPSVVFIDPDLTDIPAGNDDHPPSRIDGGQQLVKRVYDALTKKKEHWAKTMLIVTYDEYGGFYDHVLPPEISDPDNPNYVSPMFNDPQFPEQVPPGQFNPLPVHYRGPRVPAFIVSPWVEAGGVSHLVFDHTSILKTIITRFLHDNPPRLGERVDRANGLQNVLSAPPIKIGSGGVLAKPAPRVAAVSPSLPTIAQLAAPAIPPDKFADDFRTLMSAVRDRNRLR